MLSALASRLVKVNTTMLRSASLACSHGLMRRAPRLVAPTPMQHPHAQQRAVTAHAQRGRPPTVAGSPKRKSSSMPPVAGPPPLDAPEPPPPAAAVAPPPPPPAVAAPPPSAAAAAAPVYTTKPLRTIPSLGKKAAQALTAPDMTNAGDLQRYFVEVAKGNTDAMKKFLNSKGVTLYAGIIGWLVRECPQAASAAQSQQGTNLRDVSGLGKKSVPLLLQQNISSTEGLLNTFRQDAESDLVRMKELLKSYGITQNKEILDWLAGESNLPPLSDAKDGPGRRGPLRSIPGVGGKGAVALTEGGITTPDELKAYYANTAKYDAEVMKKDLWRKYGITNPSIIVTWLEGQDY